MKYYFENKNSEISYSKSYFIDIMKERGLKEIELYEAIIEKIPGMFWCDEFLAPCEVGEGCGRDCYSYTPRNLISGICVHHSFLREPGKKVKLKYKP